MKIIARIRENDEADGAIINIGYEAAEYEEETGYRVAADNGDDVGYYRPKTADECIEDIYSMWQDWDTFEVLLD